MFNKINDLAKRIKEELGQVVLAIRVYSNCLLLYFKSGAVRFYSKRNKDWGRVGKIFFVTVNFNPQNLSKKLREEFKELIEWTKRWVEASSLSKLILNLEYNIKFS